MNLVKSRVFELLLPIGMLLSTSSFVRADRAIEPLSALVNKAEIVAIGVVVETAGGKQRGGYRVFVELEDVLRCPAFPRWR